ncbi:MAG TPA: DUF4383 domain-containing protein [Solirubrobacterales bacterium]|jgi:hypothetical protein|nr:DUF4383 domain-containing protein [Solirubrobacterales bacterium]
MDAPSPARLYATAVGAVLIVAGIVGFFYSASFGSPGEVDQMLGAFSINGWVNVFHVLTGALGLLVAGYASRRYALWLGALYVALTLWGFAIGSGEAILGAFPVSTGDNLVHLLLGALGVGAALATPAAQKGEPATA